MESVVERNDMADDSTNLRLILLKIHTRFASVGLASSAALALALLGAYALLASYVYLEPSLPTVDAMRSRQRCRCRCASTPAAAS